MGFPLPFHRYMANKDFQGYLHEKILPKMKARGIVDADYVEDNLKGIVGDNNRWQYAGLWKAITFEVFCEQFLDKKCYVERG